MPRCSLIGGLLFGAGAPAVTDAHLDASGRIAGLGAAPDGFEADSAIDLSGQWLIANLTDMSACLSIAGRELTESINGELAAVEARGISQVLMRPGARHYVDHSDHVRQLNRICSKFGPRVAVSASLFRHNPGAGESGGGYRRFIDFHSMREAGCRNIDIPARTRYSPRDIEKAMILAESLDMRINITALDPDLAGTGCCHEGNLSALLGLDGISVSAEAVSLLMHTEIAASTGCRVHFSQLSSARAIEIFARARADNPRLSADVGISHLAFTVEDIAGYQPLLHTIPPLRGESDRRALLAAVNDGVVQCISSAHTPLGASGKCNPFPGVDPGVSALDAFVPQIVGLIQSDQLDARAAMAAISVNADALFHHLDSASELGAGDTPVFSIIDPRQERLWRPGDLLSGGKNSPWIGKSLPGTVTPRPAS